MVAMILSLICLVLLSTAQAEEVDQSAHLIAIEHSIEAATVNSDTDLLRSIYSASFLFTHGDRWIGLDDENTRVDTKSTWLDFLARRKGVFVARESIVDAVELHDDVAITTGCIYVQTKSEDPERSTYSIRYVRVYAKREERWKLLSHRTVGVGVCPDRKT